MNWKEIKRQHSAVSKMVFDQLQEEISSLANSLANAIRSGNKLMICGNGGSAADAQHFAAELLNRFLLDREPYAALALTTDSSVITSVANDYSYDDLFAKQVRGLGNIGDVLIGISTSGKSESVCRAIRTANEMGIKTVALTGGSGGRLAEEAETTINIDVSSETARIQEGHELIIHLLSERIEELLESRPESL